MKVFVDTDVIIDVLLERKDFNYSIKVLEYLELGKLKGVTSPVIITNIFYIVSKEKSKNEAWGMIRKLRLLFKITKINQSIIDKALTSNFKDFEDAIQYYSALDNKVDYLVTRNKSDYVGKEIVIVSPQELLALIDKN